MWWGIFINFIWFVLGVLIGTILVFNDAINNGVCKRNDKTGFEWIKPDNDIIEGENNEV